MIPTAQILGRAAPNSGAGGSLFLSRLTTSTDSMLQKNDQMGFPASIRRLDYFEILKGTMKVF